MGKQKKVKTYSFDEIKDKFIGKKGTHKREQYEHELKLELLGEMIRKVRKERNLTQEELGKLIGVQKAQISKLHGGYIENIGGASSDHVVQLISFIKTKVRDELGILLEEEIQFVGF